MKLRGKFSILPLSVYTIKNNCVKFSKLRPVMHLLNRQNYKYPPPSTRSLLYLTLLHVSAILTDHHQAFCTHIYVLCDIHEAWWRAVRKAETCSSVKYNKVVMVDIRNLYMAQYVRGYRNKPILYDRQHVENTRMCIVIGCSLLVIKVLRKKTFCYDYLFI
jgi:hypothetical protein